MLIAIVQNKNVKVSDEESPENIKIIECCSSHIYVPKPNITFMVTVCFPCMSTVFFTVFHDHLICRVGIDLEVCSYPDTYQRKFAN